MSAIESISGADAAVNSEVVAAPPAPAQEAACAKDTKDCKPTAAGRGRSEPRSAQPSAASPGNRRASQQSQNYSRLATVTFLSALSLAVLAADIVTFGRNASGGWVAELLQYNSTGGYAVELVLCLSFIVLALARYGPPRFRPAVPLPTRPAAGAGAGYKKARGGHAFAGSAASKAGAAAADKDGGPGSAQPRRSSVVSRWNQAIDVAARNGDPEKAGQLLLDLEKAGGQPESVSYNLVIRAYAKKGDAVGAEKWLKRMEARGVPVTVCSYNTMLDACAKADDAVSCEAWLRHMIAKGIEANVISYATAIYARARRGDIAASEGWLHKMKEAGIQPDAVSYNSLIHACGVKGNAQEAERWLQEMRSQGLELSVATYTAVIDACAKSGDVPRAERWLEQMIQDGVEPNVVTYSAMIDACAKAGNLPRAEYWHDGMTAKGISPNAHSYSAVINACAKHGAPGGAEAAERWLDRSEKAGVVNDVVVYSSVIDACGKAGDAERAMRVFRRMQANGLRPHIVAYAALARPFAYRGDWIKVESIAQCMHADGVSVNEYFVYAQLLAYAVARPRQAQRAEACFRSALAGGVEANDHVVTALARAVGRQRCTDLMAELCGGREVPLPPPRRTDASARGAGPARGTERQTH